MKRHLFLIDSLSKLTIKKDSTLLLCQTLQSQGFEVYVFFEQDLQISTFKSNYLSAYLFEATLIDQSFYLKNFKITKKVDLELCDNDIIHMRLDPPFDLCYLRSLWILEFYQKKGIQILNSAQGILSNNEKINALTYSEYVVPTYLGTNSVEMNIFLHQLKNHQEFDSIVLKPLDLYQGIGVEKVELDSEVNSTFEKKVKNFGMIVVQPYLSQVESGEVRAIYFKEKNLGNILKIPKKGSFLANIAQGASFHSVDLNETQKERCQKICHDLTKIGVHWVAFDLLGDFISEVNITCPGLLVEVSQALKQNLALEMIKLF